MPEKQPKALQLADILEEIADDGLNCQVLDTSACELRRLHTENKNLSELLTDYKECTKSLTLKNHELLHILKALQNSLDYEELPHDDQRVTYCKSLELTEQQEEPNV